MNWPRCEVADGHPVLRDLLRFHVRGPAEKLFEEAYDWARPMTDDECLRRHLVGVDVNMAFAAGINGLPVGLGTLTHVTNPVFVPKLPGSWLVDLSHVDLSKVKVGKERVELDDSLLPSPFTPEGDRPTGVAWYATPTVAYARELGYEVRPTEAWVRRESGRYLDGWYDRLRDAYLATMADLGVDADLPPEDFLAAMDGSKSRDPELAIAVSAVKATVKGGLGKLRERPRGEGWRPGEPWRALSRPTWRPDIRAAVISRTRINLHRKIVKHAAFTGQYPVAVLSGCVVYAADGPSPLDFLPYREGRPLPGGFRLGINPGLVKHEGTQEVLWGEEVRERFNAPELNLARYIKDGTVTDVDNGEQGSGQAMSMFGDSLDKAVQKAFTRPTPKSAGPPIRYMVKQLGGTKAVAELLGMSRRQVERYVAGKAKKPRADLAARPEREVAKRWQPQIRAKARQKAAGTGGIVIDARARMGYTAPIGSTDQDRIRHLTVALPPLFAARLFEAQEAGASGDQLQEIAAEALKEVYFQDGGRRAGSLEEVRFTDVEHLEFGLWQPRPEHSASPVATECFKGPVSVRADQLSARFLPGQRITNDQGPFR